ncbi:glycosyltransferase [Methylobacterium iners]|uniref:O-mycaminosyltylonolide 6-deoxyallosyltransferase n=1 Tax=Methylobacterium iners TaxID=418707 RepID=A0ABQ4RWK3_9HYPH|nr:glycosyltransferase [Methylobacterium iners]GJD94765.1 O-mycaminosyltylonolide 6-deoxyallosyltransferase [Methylobacterium iners]
MRIVILSYGSRGDVQPQVALAVGLRDVGHDVVLAAPENLQAFVEAAGVTYAKLPGDSLAILQSERGQLWLSSGNVRAFFREVAEISLEVTPRIYQSALEICEGADAIVGGTFCEDIAVTLAEYYRVRACLLYTCPQEPTRCFPNILVTRTRLPFEFLNLLTYKLVARLGWRIIEPSLTPFRASLSLPPWSSSVLSRSRSTGILAIQMWSEVLVPHAGDLPPNVITSGIVRLPKAVRSSLGEGAPAHLLDWLPRGPKPVYLGFGSMPIRNPSAFTQMALTVADELVIRVVISGGWAGLGAAHHQITDRACFIQSSDHSWLLPHCAAAVHHGGAGTTAASLDAGIPSLICSVFADQPFWGHRVEQLGIGAHIPFAKLDAKRLKEGLRRVMAEPIQARAAALVAQVRAEDGNRVALDALKHWLEAPATLPRLP